MTYVMIFAHQVSLWRVNFKRVSQTLSTPETTVIDTWDSKAFQDCCDIIWILSYVNLGEINCIEETFLWLFRKCDHVYSLSEKAYAVWSFSLDTHFQWKLCSTQHTQLSGTQGFERCSPTGGSIVYNNPVLQVTIWRLL